MNFSEKFKKSINLTDINYTDNSIVKSKIVSVSKAKNSAKDSYISIPSLDDIKTKDNKFADLAIETIEKINKNPFWSEYPQSSKERMIEKYFDNKIKRAKYNDTKYSSADKIAFVKGVLRSVV